MYAYIYITELFILLRVDRQAQMEKQTKTKTNTVSN